jgi:CDP-6-deoxy-D-xylo-4-hexulose-3-dehydrase
MLFGGNLTKQPAYEGIAFKALGELENTDRVMNDLFWIGVYPGLTEESIKYMITCIQEMCRRDGSHPKAAHSL